MINMKSFNKALKSAWVKKHLDNDNHGKWKLTHLCIFNFSASVVDNLSASIKRNWRNNIISCILISFTHQVEVFSFIVLSIVALLFYSTLINNILKPDLVSVVTAHTIYFCAFARSEISLLAAGFFSKGHWDERLVIANANVQRRRRERVVRYRKKNRLPAVYSEIFQKMPGN